MKVFGILLAAGLSERFESDKLFALYKDKELIRYPIETFLNCDDIDSIVIVCNETNIEKTKEILNSYVIDKTYNLNIIDKIIQKPYVDNLDDLFSGEYSATYIDQKLTRYTEQLFTPEFLNEYENLEIFDEYKKAINSNSLMNANIIGDIFLIHSKEDEVVPYGQSQNLFESIKSKGGNAELVLLEKGKHSPQDYVMSVVDALKWLEQYD